MNESQIRPMGYNVLVKPSEVEATTKGGIILADETREKEEFGRMEGTLVAVSPMAFTFEGDWPESEPKPAPGTKVIFSRYSATEITGRDGGKYWLMKDSSVAATLEDGA